VWHISSSRPIRTIGATGFRLILFAILFGTFWAGTVCAQRQKLRKSNIVVLFADDLGYGDLGVYGYPTIRTPNLDKMAAEGIKFTQFYSGAPLCTSSRAALLTGRFPVRSGMTRVLFPHSATGLPAPEITLPEAVREQGYATALIGKWHLGHRPQDLPAQHGFDFFYGLPYSNDMDRSQTRSFEEAVRNPKIESFNLPLMRNQDVIERPADQRTLTKRYTDESIRFIQKQKKKPFFLYLAYTMPHVPLFASDSFKGRSARGRYGDVVEELDWSVGKILTTLRKLGLGKPTLVIFISDNGPALDYRLGGGSAGLLRKGKGTVFEGGMREPAIAWWPGVIAPGRVTPTITSLMDIFPTSVELAGGRASSDRQMDGVSLLPVLHGVRDSVRTMLLYYAEDRLAAIRKGPWKAHSETPTDNSNNAQEDSERVELYQLEWDPAEQFDIAAKYPEIVADLKREREAHLASMRAKP